MADRHKALTELRDAVARSDDYAHIDFYGPLDGEEDHGLTARNAYRGSLDAALAFKDAVLPGTFSGVSQNIHHGTGFGWVQSTARPIGDATASTPARALLLATLAALIAQETRT